MFNCCPLCRRPALKFHAYFPDQHNQQVDLWMCHACKCIVPKYTLEVSVNPIEQQTSFHENWWRGSTDGEFIKTLEELKPLIRDLRPCLGDPGPQNVVLEIGSGRGSLLRALVDAGYKAYGCEPSSALCRLAREHYLLTPELLFELPADQFIKDVVPSLPASPNAIILWHVLEHLEFPLLLLRNLSGILATNKCLILQLPLLCQQYVYPEHYFFVTHETLGFISSELGLELDAVDYDTYNLFVTAHFKKSATYVANRLLPFLQYDTIPSWLTQSILLRDRGNQALRSVVRERDETIRAQTKLIDDGVAGMTAMERMIRERDETIRAQTKLIDHGIAELESFKKNRLIRALMFLRVLG